MIHDAHHETYARDFELHAWTIILYLYQQDNTM